MITRRAVWRLLLVALAVGLALVGMRVWRLARQARQLQRALRETAAQSGDLVASPTRKQFSPGFLQMAFGDHPSLLTAVTELIRDAQRRDPQLDQGQVTLMVATFRPHGESVRDVAVWLFGVPALEEPGAAAVPTSGTAQETARHAYQLTKSLAGEMANRVRLVTAPANRARESQLLDALERGRSTVVESYLREPVGLVVVMPQPDPLLGGGTFVAALVKGELSLAGGRGEIVVLGYESRRAAELAEFLTDSRMLAGGLVRAKFSDGPVDLLVRPITQAQITSKGPTVLVRGTVQQELMEIGLTRFVSGLAKLLRSPTPKATPVAPR